MHLGRAEIYMDAACDAELERVLTYDLGKHTIPPAAQDRWVRYEYTKKAKVESVVIDPDHKINLDRDNFNNSRLVKGNGSPARKLINYWTFLTQFVAQCLAGWMV